jgi:hypothetical protein
MTGNWNGGEGGIRVGTWDQGKAPRWDLPVSIDVGVSTWEGWSRTRENRTNSHLSYKPAWNTSLDKALFSVKASSPRLGLSSFGGRITTRLFTIRTFPGI